MYLEKICNFNAILNVFLENKNSIHGINAQLYYLITVSSVYKVKNYLTLDKNFLCYSLCLSR